MLDSMLDQFGRGGANAADIATIYAGLGDKQAAFAWIDRIDAGRGAFVVDRLEILLEDLRSDPRIEAVRRRFGIRTDNGSRTGVGSVSPR